MVDCRCSLLHARLTCLPVLVAVNKTCLGVQDGRNVKRIVERCGRLVFVAEHHLICTTGHKHGNREQVIAMVVLKTNDRERCISTDGRAVDVTDVLGVCTDGVHRTLNTARDKLRS